VIRQTFVPTVRPSTAFILIFISVVGTTITPWMAFFQQSNVADKGLHPSDLTYERVDTGIGIFMTQIVAFFIIVACGATIFAHHVRIDPSDPSAFNKIALSLAPFCRPLCHPFVRHRPDERVADGRLGAPADHDLRHH